MSYEIQKLDDHVEIRLSGEISHWDVLLIFGRLRLMTPRKELSDVWVLSDDCAVPQFASFPTMVQYSTKLMPRDMVLNRSAIVVSNHLQKAQAEMYRREASGLPYEIGVFSDRENAVAWVREKNKPS